MSSSSDSDFESDFIDNCAKKTKARLKNPINPKEAATVVNPISLLAPAPAPAPTYSRKFELNREEKEDKEGGSKKRKLPPSSRENSEDSVELVSSLALTPPPSSTKSPGDNLVQDTPISSSSQGVRDRLRKEMEVSAKRAPRRPPKAAKAPKRMKKTDKALLKLQRQRSKFAQNPETEERVDDEETDESDSSTENGEEKFELKVNWKNDVMRFSALESDTVQLVLEKISDRLSIPFLQLKLYLCDQCLSLSEELSTYAITVLSILEVRKSTTAPGDKGSKVTPTTAQVNPMISLKCQTKDRKSTLLIKIGADEKMITLMKKYSDGKKVPLKKLKFMFDGEDLDPNATPNSLDLEGDECIDVY